jgi:CelD/BcsL family acetyltransferase involved in cellulose biosynthesis
MIEQLSLGQWQAFDGVHPAPTFFARPAWAMALADVYPNVEPALLRVRETPRDAILIPTVRMRGGALRWKEFCAFPLGGYTCFMHEDGTLATEAAAERALHHVERFVDTATIIPWPLGPTPAAPAQTRHETAVVDLKNGLDAALSRIDGKYRRMAGQAERRGVVCSRSEDADAADTYYGLLSESAKRWGIPEPTERKGLIEAVLRFGGDSAEVWFARAEGRPVAGGVVFYGSQELFFWSAAMLAEFGRLRPSNALNYALLHAAAARGVRWYNLGSSEGLPGVERFKLHLGAQPVPYSTLHLSRIRYKIYTNVRRLLPARAR